MQKPEERLGWLGRWAPVLFWAAVTWTFSTGFFTQENTSRVIIPVLHWIFPHASHAALLRMHHFVRKCAHFFEYFVFSLLLLRALRGQRRGPRLAWSLAVIALIFGWACLDEFHQSFVPGRAGADYDIFVDTGAAIAAQVFAALFSLRRGKERQLSSGNNGQKSPAL